MIAAPDDTVVAPASAPGPSPRAVVRLSGAQAHALAGQVFAPLPSRGFCWRAGTLTLPGWPPAPAEAVTFRGPRSYTGEDAVELWVPGAPPLVDGLVQALVAAGARLAEPGELTRRAFLSGRIDLTQAEAVLALTTSADRQAARGALRALGGGAREAVDAAKALLLDVVAHLEAAIDFSEDDLDLAAEADLAERVERADRLLAGLERACGRRPAPAGRAAVTLCGPPNAGKSTLFNRLAGATALVSEAAGTTRDALVHPWLLPGAGAVDLIDTAGDGEAAGVDDRRAQAVARAEAEAADVLLVVVEAARPDRALEFLRPGQAAIVALSKCDLGAPPAVALPVPAVAVSGRTGAGCAELAGHVVALLGGEGAAAGELTATARQLERTGSARAALGAVAALLAGDDPARVELAAAEVGRALRALGELTGAVTTDAILERIFAQFCVGK